MLHRLKAILLPAVLYISMCQVPAQQTEAMRSPDVAYHEAMEWMNSAQYEAARRAFSDYLAENRDENSEHHIDAKYYQAYSSMQLFHKDAEFMMEEFVMKHPESNWKNPAILALGNYNFNRRDYDDALYWLKRVDETDLTAPEKEEVQFKKGFSSFELEQFAEAKSYFYKLKDSDGAYNGPVNYYYGHIAYTEGNYQTALESLEKAADDPNFEPVVPYYTAQIYHFQKKYDQLIAYAEPMMANSETVRKEEIAHLLGNAYYEKQDYDKSVPYLETYIRSNYNPSPEDAYQMAFAYYRSGEYKKAIDYYSKAAKADSDTLVQIATYQMADAYVKVDEKKYAQNAFKVASQMDADREITEDALFNYAKLAYELSYDPFHEAIQAFEKYLNTYPNSDRKDEAYEFLLKVYLATKNYSSALDAMDKMKSLNAADKSRYQECAYNLAVEEMGKGNFNTADDNFKLSRKYSESPKLVALSYYWTGDLRYRSGEYDKALTAYSTYLSNSSAYQTQYYNTANYNMGYCYFKTEEYAKSLTAFRKYISADKLDPKRKTDALLRIGDLNLVRKDYGQAVESYENALSTKGMNGDYALFQIAEAYGYQEKHDQKVQTLNRLFKEHPETTLAAAGRFELGDSYFIQNQLNFALTSFNTVIEEYPQSPYRKKALLKRGLVQYRQGNYDASIASYKQVVAEYGVDAESNEAVATLKNIYLDLGKVDEYSDWVNDIPDYQVSATEIDSLTYQSAENLVADGNCDKAMPAFANYLQKYPNGLFTIDANYYLSECAYRRNDFDKALQGFEYVTTKPVGQFSEPALIGAANIRFSRKEYDKALTHFQQLEQVATFATNKLAAQAGKMRSQYELGNYDKALLATEQVLKNDGVDDVLRLEAKLMQGRILFIQKNYIAARDVFRPIAENQNSKAGAEAKYRLAEISYLERDLDMAEQQIFELAQGFASFDFWKIKGFLLLADVYVERKDFFQARATLKSVIDNVKDQNFVNQAKSKMNDIDMAEQRQISAGDTIPGADTLDFEDDYRDLIDEPNSGRK